MKLYYPEVFNSDWNRPSRKFFSEEMAINYYQAIYGDRLQAVVRDDDLHIDVVWEARSLQEESVR